MGKEVKDEKIENENDSGIESDEESGDNDDEESQNEEDSDEDIESDSESEESDDENVDDEISEESGDNDDEESQSEEYIEMISDEYIESDSEIEDEDPEKIIVLIKKPPVEEGDEDEDDDDDDESQNEEDSDTDSDYEIEDEDSEESDELTTASYGTEDEKIIVLIKKPPVEESDEVEDNIIRNDEAVNKDDAAEITVNVIKTVLESAPLIKNENENENVEISFWPKNAAAVPNVDESDEVEDYIKRNDEEYAVNKELVKTLKK